MATGKTNCKVQTNKLPSFGEATDEELTSIISKFYADEIGIDEIKKYWSVGDSRTVSLSAMGASYVGESHAAQNVEFVIIGFEHDSLTSSINNHSKALLTLHMKNCLNETGYMSTAQDAYSYGKWSSCARRNWAQEVFEKALPSYLQSAIKTVFKITCEAISGGNSSSAYSYFERCFMPSNWELFGAAYQKYCTAQDGSQYEYYKTTSNRIKYVNGSKYWWWTRSGYWYKSLSLAEFVICGQSGTVGNEPANGSMGIAMAFCL